MGNEPEVVQIEINEVAGALAAELTGRKWRVRAFEYGLSKNRYAADGGGTLPLLWTERAAPSAIRALEGARAFADHADQPSVRNLIGCYSEARAGARGPEATLTILESEDWAARKMLAAAKAGRPGLIGFSMNAHIAAKPVAHDGGRALEVQEVIAIHSLDMVSAASSGGQALEILEGQGSGGDPAGEIRSANGAKHKEQTMKEQIKRVLESLRKLPAAGAAKARIDAVEAELNQEGSKPETVLEKATALAAELTTAAPVAEGGAGQEVAAIQEQIKTLTTQVQEAQRAQKVAEGRLLLNRKLAESKLAIPLQSLVREEFEGATEITEVLLDARIKRVRETYAAVVDSPTRVSSRPAIAAGPDSRAKKQTALDRLLGVKKTYQVVREMGITEEYTRLVDKGDIAGDVPAFHTLHEAIQSFAEEDGRASRVFENLNDLAVREDWLSTGFTNALGNTLYRRMIQDYREKDYGLDMLIPPGAPHRRSLRDFRTHEVIRVGYLGDLATHDPEASEWPEIAAPTDEKATYSAVQFGGLISVSRKTIINDDVGLVVKVGQRLGRALRRTLAQRVFNLMINNGAVYDGVTWAHATSHGANLNTTALDEATLDVVRTEMRNQTEKDAAKRLGHGPYILVVPHDLEGLARITNSREYVDSNFTPSKVRFMFGTNGERIIVSSLLTDPNDWYTFADPNEVQSLELGFLQGREEPELLIADNELVGQAFTQDRIQYKGRHEYEVVVVDFRGFSKNAVT